LSVFGVVAVSSRVAALSAVCALARIVRNTVSREVRCRVGDALTVVCALDIALVTRNAVSRRSAIATVLTDQRCTERSFGQL
jgi:hypothetical protein